MIVHVIKKGKNSSVSRLDEYAVRKVVTRTVKPLKNRKLKIDILNPLGAVDGAPIGPLTRDLIYEELLASLLDTNVLVPEGSRDGITPARKPSIPECPRKIRVSALLQASIPPS
jgi:hypothetical protein